MVRLGQKAKKFGAIGLKVAGTGLSVYSAFSVGKKAGDMSDNASMTNFNRAEDEKQARARETYLSGNSKYAGVSDYVSSGKLSALGQEGFEF
tara:strand:+ start:2230 stop:2505 length:276 start_codon:yes stop_codon:yes gene_type:complete